jgi:hypothetical protein
MFGRLVGSAENAVKYRHNDARQAETPSGDIANLCRKWRLTQHEPRPLEPARIGMAVGLV